MKLSKKILCIFLVLLSVFSFSIPAFAEDLKSDKEKETTTSLNSFQQGDVDLNGSVNSADARIVLRVAARLMSIDSFRLSIADFDKDGAVNSKDARYILRHGAKLDPYAPDPTTTTTTTTKAPETTTVLTDATRKYTLAKSNLFKTNYAKYAAIYDYDNDKILYEKGLNYRCYPASTTKIITAVLGCEYLSADYVLTVGKEQNLVAANASRAGLYIGQKIKFKEILKSLLVPSGCDAAYTIAVHVAREASGNKNMSSQAALTYFVNLMNSYTKELGMKNSHFVNPDGYPHSNHYTTAGDMIKIAVKAYSFKLIRNVVNQPWTTAYFESGGSATYTNSNETINPYSDRYYPYMVGMKTGSHSYAGQCLVTVAKKKNEKTGKTRTFVAVVYNCPSKYGRYMDLKGLYNTAFANFPGQP